MGMGSREEEDMVIRKEKKSKKKKKIDNDNDLFDEEVEGIIGEELKEDDKKKKKKEKKKDKGSDLQKVNGVEDELDMEKDYSGLNDEKKKKLEFEGREKKEKKNKGNDIEEELVGEKDVGETKHKRKRKSEFQKQVEQQENDSEIGVLKKEKKWKKEKKEKDKGSSGVVCEDSNRKINVEGEMNSESFSLCMDEKKSDNEIEIEVKKGKKKRRKEKKYESKEGVISSLDEIQNYKEPKETRESKFKSIGEEDILAEEGSTVHVEKKETKKRKKHQNVVSDEGREKQVHDEGGSGVDVEYCKKRKKDKSFESDPLDCSRETLDMPVVEKEDCNKGHSGSVGKKKRDREKGSLDVEMEKADESMRKKGNSVKDVEEKNVNGGESTTKNKEGRVDCSGNPEPKKPSKSVKFSCKVEVFPLSDEDLDRGKKSLGRRKKALDGGERGVDRANKDLNHGKRFTKEEDCIIQNAVLDYIKEHDLGDNGLEKVLHCQKYKEAKNCWKEIGTSMPWRSTLSIYSRAHILFERAEKREWTPEEKELLRKFHEEHGSDWRKFADEYGKSRIHTKDTWRRICVPNRKKGPWSQEEYQKLFDLVNMDLLMKVHDEKKSKHGMLRDNIAWEAISQKLSSRTMAECCMKWYNQLESPLIREEKWANTDDIRLLNALQDRDFSSEEEVDWDDLLDHRSGDLCRKRWQQMVKHLGMHGLREFAAQVETLANRYCSEVLEAREIYEKKTPVD